MTHGSASWMQPSAQAGRTSRSLHRRHPLQAATGAIMTGFEHKDYQLIESTPWGVPVIDVQPLAQNVVSCSEDPSCARNVLSYTGEDGAELAAQTPPSGRVVQTALRIPIDQVLADGVVCKPGAMEDKWAVYLHARRLLFIRSWLRRVVAG